MKQTRREALQFIFKSFLACSATTVCSSNVFGQWPGQNEPKEGGGWPGTDPRSEKTENSWTAKGNCMLAGQEARSVQEQIRIIRTTGNAFVDRLMNEEVYALKQYTGMRPGFSLFDDRRGPNAFATSEALLGEPDGTVMFGATLLNQEWDPGLQGAPIVMIMMHEWTHIYQFAEDIDGESKKMELLSDYMAGWWLGLKHRGGLIFDARWAARSVFSKGDFNFNSPGHHGTPEERLDHLTDGYHAGRQGPMRYDDAFSRGMKSVGL